MTVLWVPPLEDEPYPSLGALVCDFMESNLVYGPGDLRGLPIVLSQQQREFIWRIYEVRPENDPRPGRRRFRRVALSLRKGLAKTELAALIAAVELHPDGPVRCDGFDGAGNPIPRAVIDPYIPMVSTTEEQTDELAYSALRVILEESKVSADFDIGMERIVRKDGTGRAVALAGAPNARDGARTTFQHFDETHRFTTERLRAAHRAMLANIPKRPLAEPWSLETTTAPVPGERSIAEDTMDYAADIIDGKKRDARLMFFHRQAGIHDLTSRKGLREAIIEASGSDASWSDIDAIAEQWDDPTSDFGYLERVWLNRPVAGALTAFDLSMWKDIIRERPPYGVPITIGFDGSQTQDSTAIVGTDILTGTQFVIGLWERPPNALDNWEVDTVDVDFTMQFAFDEWDVRRAYCDPRWWESWIALWKGRWGEARVIDWPTNRARPMAAACSAYRTSLIMKEIGIVDESSDAIRTHLGNAVKHNEAFVDEFNNRMWTIRKKAPASPDKIDVAMGAILSWEARRDEIASGALERLNEPRWTLA